MTAQDLQGEEDASFYTEDRDQPIPPPNVVAYNELRSCADLLRMHVTGKLEIQPDFQRDVVWKGEEQTRFIDSLVKQLPIPSMCFSLDVKTQRWKVIDGLQRMHTIISFLGNDEWRLLDVDDVHPLLKRKTNSQLREGSEDERRIYSSVEDLSIPVTVIRCDYQQESHMRYLFTIFNRLNSGGVRLNNQEIRNCIYSGPFNDLLKGFDKGDSEWQRVCQSIWGRMDRFRSVEILLRAIAFSRSLDAYDGNLAGFLNNFMHRLRSPQAADIGRMQEDLKLMADSALVVLGKIGGGKKSLTFVEGILVGLLANAASIRALDAERIQTLEQRAVAFQESPLFTGATRYALSNATTVKDRLHAAIAIFSV